MRPYVEEACCISCGACESVCSADPNVFEVGEVASVVHPEVCSGDGQCAEVCPGECIQISEAGE